VPLASKQAAAVGWGEAFTTRNFQDVTDPGKKSLQQNNRMLCKFQIMLEANCRTPCDQQAQGLLEFRKMFNIKNILRL
jgi:hypothetical protein